MTQRQKPVAYCIGALLLVIALYMGAHTLLITFQDLRFGDRFMGTMYVGFHNWRMLFETRQFVTIVINTVRFLPMFVLFSLALPLAALGMQRVRSVPLRFALWGITALPLLLGLSDLAYALLRIFGVAAFSDVRSAWGLAFLIFLRDLPVLLLLLLLLDLRRRPGLLLISFSSLFAFLWSVFRSVNPPMDVVRGWQNPLNLQFTDTFRSFTFHVGFQQMRFGEGATTELICALISIMTLIAIVVLAYVFFPRNDSPEKAFTDAQPRQRTAPTAFALGWLPALAMSVFAIALIVTQWFDNPAQPMSPSILPTLVSLLGTAIAVPLGFFLSSLFTDRKSAPFAAILIGVCGFFFSIAYYLLMRRIMAINTVLPLLLYAIQPLPIAVILGLCLPVLERDGKPRATLPALLGTGLLCAAFTLRTNGYAALLVIMQPELLPLSLTNPLNRQSPNIAGGPVPILFALFLVALCAAGAYLLVRAFHTPGGKQKMPYAEEQEM